MSNPGKLTEVSCGHPSCDTKLRSMNRTGFCRSHRPPVLTDVTCAFDDCDTLLAVNNRSGYCTPHWHRSPAEVQRRAEEYAANPDTKKADARASYERRRDAGLPVRGTTTPEAIARGRRKRRALEAALFVEHVEEAVLLELHGEMCHWCGWMVDPDDFEVEHVVPLARGGPHQYANTAPAHWQCNRGRGGKHQKSGSPNPVVNQAAYDALWIYHVGAM